MTTPSFTRRTAIVDAHAHLYDGGANRYGIFARKDPGFEAFVGDYSALPRTYLSMTISEQPALGRLTASSGTNSSPRIPSRR